MKFEKEEKIFNWMKFQKENKGKKNFYKTEVCGEVFEVFFSKISPLALDPNFIDPFYNRTRMKHILCKIEGKVFYGRKKYEFTINEKGEISLFAVLEEKQIETLQFAILKVLYENYYATSQEICNFLESKLCEMFGDLVEREVELNSPIKKEVSFRYKRQHFEITFDGDGILKVNSNLDPKNDIGLSIAKEIFGVVPREKNLLNLLFLE